MSTVPLHRLATPAGPTFEVMDLPTALASFQDYNAVISLLDPGVAVDFPPHAFHRVFGLRDVQSAQGASLEQIREILGLDFSQAQRVLIHCEVGVSRSPSVAMLLAARWGADDEAILRGICWARACPNRRILELGEAVLGMSGRLTGLVAAARNRMNQPSEGAASCEFCGAPLPEADVRWAETLDRLLALALEPRPLKGLHACSRCEDRFSEQEPEGFGAEGWRRTLATHSAARLVRLLRQDACEAEIETLGLSELVFLNLLNEVDEVALLAAKERAEHALERLRPAVDPPVEVLEAPARHRIMLPGDCVLDIRGLPEARAIYQDYDAVISLQDPWAEVAWNDHPRHWIFRVRDIEGEAEFAPNLELVRQILDLDLSEAHRILVHCHEGFSRSTATAILLATKLGADRDAILDGLDWTHAYPNQRILGFGEEILGTEGRLIDLVDEGLRRGGWQ